MVRWNRRLLLFGVVWFVALSFLSAVSLAQGSRSAVLAEELVGLMNEAELQNVATRDTDQEEGRYVAALYFPGQLMIISARYEVPVYVEEKLAAKQYQEIYADLNQASVPESRTFVTDANADGLQAEVVGDERFDSYDSGGQQLRFDGRWTRQQMTEDDYRSAFSEAEAQYTRMLEALLAEIR